MWIRIGSEFNGVPGSGAGSGLAIQIQKGKNDRKNRKQLINFVFCSAGCSLLRAKGFSCGLGVLYEGLGISKLQRYKKIVSCLYFIQFLVMKTMVPQIHLKRWIQIRIRNPDPQYCFICIYTSKII